MHEGLMQGFATVYCCDLHQCCSSMELHVVPLTQKDSETCKHLQVNAPSQEQTKKLLSEQATISNKRRLHIAALQPETRHDGRAQLPPEEAARSWEGASRAPVSVRR